MLYFGVQIGFIVNERLIFFNNLYSILIDVPIITSKLKKDLEI